MWRIRRSLQAILTALLLGCLTIVQLTPIRADAADVPSLIVSQLKITSGNGQFVTLYNATGTALDASHYQLQYFNNFDLSKATSSKLIALSGIIPPHGYLMVSDGTTALCYQLVMDAVSLGFSSTAGMVQIVALNQPVSGGPVNASLQDYVGWSKTATNGAQTLPNSAASFLVRQSGDTGVPLIDQPGEGAWMPVHPEDDAPCVLISDASPAVSLNGAAQLLLPTEPPAVISADAGPAAAGVPVLPPADVGLMSPVINELLPNPAGTGTDSSDEFIELYNPNAATFDLSGFSLQTGLSTYRSFTFPNGTLLPAHGFSAFYSARTGLSLSNTASQVRLLDPFGKSISTSEPYSTAKDGIAWALAKGKWYWTTTPTPGKANSIHQPVVKKAAATASKKTTGTVVKNPAKVAAASTTAGTTDEPSATPVHLQALALVIGGAILYGAYEYRTDVANRIHRLRRYIGDRHADRT